MSTARIASTSDIPRPPKPWPQPEPQPTPEPPTVPLPNPKPTPPVPPTPTAASPRRCAGRCVVPAKTRVLRRSRGTDRRLPTAQSRPDLLTSRKEVVRILKPSLASTYEGVN
jgi:hypothetical protein